MNSLYTWAQDQTLGDTETSGWCYNNKTVLIGNWTGNSVSRIKKNHKLKTDIKLGKKMFSSIVLKQEV